MKKFFLKVAFVICTFISTHQSFAYYNDTIGSNLQLPPGFTSTVIAEGLQGARHLAVTKQGAVYVKLARLKDGKGIWYLKDTNSDGKTDVQFGFGNYPGTGIRIKNGFLYASSNDAVYRYALNDQDEVIDTANPERIVYGLVDRNHDNSKSIALDNNGNLYVNVGSYTNACLLNENSTKAPDPCPLLDSVGGIWKFKADKLNQTYKDAIHYATGFKNIVGLDWNTATNSLFVLPQGRDQLHDLFPQYYTEEQAKLLPAETMYELHQGSNGGWPYVYYDHFQKKKILAPEYGGDGKKTGGENAQDPVVAFPAHLAPDGLTFYTGNAFPTKYKNGAFIAFHGKSPELQKGYFIVFVAFKNGKPAGDWQVFADDFAGIDLTQKDAGPRHKPCGVTVGDDGSLYVTDDAGGNIYRISYAH